MTRTQSDANWSGAPSLSHPWMAALLRLAAMLVSNAAYPLRMLLTLLPRECHTDVERDRLPVMEDGYLWKDNEPAAATSQLMKTLTLFVSPLIPAKAWVEERSAKRTKRTTFRATNARSASAGREGSPRSLFGREPAAQNQSKPIGLFWIPAFAGTSGEELLAASRS